MICRFLSWHFKSNSV